jgi:hypothetical protein
MTKLDFDWTLKQLSGEPMEGNEEGSHAGKLLGGLLGSSNETTQPIKFFDWALKFYNKQPLELDSTDLEILKKFIKESRRLYVIAQAQLLNCITEAESASSKKAK